MYLTGIMQLGVAKSFSAACVQYQINKRFIMVKKFIKLFFIKMGVIHLTPTNAVRSEIPKLNDSANIFISSVELD